jgi:hypothetical protein
LDEAEVDCCRCFEGNVCLWFGEGIEVAGVCVAEAVD